MTEKPSPSEHTQLLEEVASSHVTPLSQKRSHEVSAKEGDIVSALALVHYGTINDTIIDIVKRANPEILDLDRIEIGQKINFPTLTIENFIIENEDGMFTIHVSTFSVYDHALRLHKQCERKDYSSSISPVKVVGKNNWYRVTVGNFSSRSEAIEYARKTNLDEVLYKL